MRMFHNITPPLQVLRLEQLYSNVVDHPRDKEKVVKFDFCGLLNLIILVISRSSASSFGRWSTAASAPDIISSTGIFFRERKNMRFEVFLFK